MQKSYIHFAELFGRLSPYELKHLSECILCKIEEGFEEKLCGSTSRIELTEKDLKFATTEAMLDILLALKEQEFRNNTQRERMKYKKTKTLIFADRKLAA
jgi:hypothetical protein